MTRIQMVDGGRPSFSIARKLAEEAVLPSLARCAIFWFLSILLLCMKPGEMLLFIVPLLVVWQALCIAGATVWTWKSVSVAAFPGLEDPVERTRWKTEFHRRYLRTEWLSWLAMSVGVCCAIGIAHTFVVFFMGAASLMFVQLAWSNLAISGGSVGAFWRVGGRAISQKHILSYRRFCLFLGVMCIVFSLHCGMVFAPFMFLGICLLVECGVIRGHRLIDPDATADRQDAVEAAQYLRREWKYARILWLLGVFFELLIGAVYIMVASSGLA